MTTLATQPQRRTLVDTSEAVVRCAGLSKVFKDFWLRNRVRAVDNIDFEIFRGEVFGLLGPNGSGKSTTIKMILGLLHATSGRISVFGKPPSDVSIKQRIGYLPEESYLYRFLNARETLDYYGRLFHQDRRQRQRRIDMLLDMVGLDQAQRRPVGEYSKGMQRRIGLAQALINDPDLLILDEPTTGLDPIGTRQVKDLILDLARPRNGKPGKTVLLCSHLLSDVEDVCDRVAIMFGGKVRKYGTVDELLVQEGRTTLQTPTLTPELIQKVEELLERHGQHIEKVDQPRQKLEQLFLDIVNQALAEGAAFSGAGVGGKTAQFLTDGTQPPEGEAVIDRLVAQGQPRPATETTPQVVQPQADQRVMDELTAKATEPRRPEPRQPEPTLDASLIEGLVTGNAPPPPTANRPAPIKPAPAPSPAAPQAPVPPPSDAARQRPSSIPVSAEDRKKREQTAEQPDRAFLDALINTDRPESDEPKR